MDFGSRKRDRDGGIQNASEALAKRCWDTARVEWTGFSLANSLNATDLVSLIGTPQHRAP